MARPNVELQRREQILRAACSVISEIGHAKLRVADVAKEAGLSSGTVHYYFDSKEAVMKAAFEYNYRHSLASRRLLLSAEQDPLTLLTKLVDSYLPLRPESMKAWRVWSELWVEGVRDPELQAINDTIYGEWRQLIVDMLVRAQAAEQVRQGDPVELANMLLGMIDGLAVQVMVHSRQMDVKLMRKVLASFIEMIEAD